MNKDLYNDFKALSNKERNELISTFAQEEQEAREQQLRDAIEAHQEYVGKCYRRTVRPRSGMFPSIYKYAKIVSSRAENQYHMTALTFVEHPLYWFEYQSHKMHFEGDYYLGNFDMVGGIQLESIGFFCNDLSHRGFRQQIERWEEISIEDYNAAMDTYVRELQCSDFVADHYRYGGVMPSSAQWKFK